MRKELLEARRTRILASLQWANGEYADQLWQDLKIVEQGLKALAREAVEPVAPPLPIGQ